MKPSLEATRLSQSGFAVAAFERCEPTFLWGWHYHPEIELTLVYRGQGSRLVGDRSQAYDSPDLVLLGGNLPHTWVSEESAKEASIRKIDSVSTANRATNRAIVIQFHPNAFPPELLALPEFAKIAQLLERAARGIEFPHSTARRIMPHLRALLPLQGITRWLKLVEILETLALSPAAFISSPRYAPGRFSVLGSRLERVLQHIEENFREEIPLEEIARIAGLTPSAFSRFFKKLSHRTYVSYRNACRIREACRLLAETDLPVTTIAYDCGFNNLANFNRRFLEEKKISPREYRKQFNPVAAR